MRRWAAWPKASCGPRTRWRTSNPRCSRWSTRILRQDKTMAVTRGSDTGAALKAPPPGALMWRVAKHEGAGNVVLEQTPIPELGPLDVLVKTHVSLISRGSELWRRYVLAEAVNPEMMGYSTTGTVVAVGGQVPALPPDKRLAPGDRVGVSAPHAAYSVRSVAESAHPRVYKLHPHVGWEEGAF